MSAKILIVDDERDTLMLIGMALERSGYQVVKANDGPMALQLARSEKPDLIILDVMMPGMSGIDVLKALRESDFPTPPVILFTARSRIEDIAKGMEAGAYRYLVKPVSREKLLETVRAALADRD